MTNTKGLSSVLLLCGMKGAGKSYFANLLEKKGFIYYDSDKKMLELLDSPLTLREFFKKEGETEFRRLEEKSLSSIFEEIEIKPGFKYVIATGGGLADNEAALRLIELYRPTVVYLKVGVDILYERAVENGLPAYLTGDNPRKQFLLIETKRDLIYSKICDFMLELSDYEESKSVLRTLEEML